MPNAEQSHFLTDHHQYRFQGMPMAYGLPTSNLAEATWIMTEADGNQFDLNFLMVLQKAFQN